MNEAEILSLKSGVGRWKSDKKVDAQGRGWLSGGQSELIASLASLRLEGALNPRRALMNPNEMKYLQKNRCDTL